jgi:hypothetical protein
VNGTAMGANGNGTETWRHPAETQFNICSSNLHPLSRKPLSERCKIWTLEDICLSLYTEFTVGHKQMALMMETCTLSKVEHAVA